MDQTRLVGVLQADRRPVHVVAGPRHVQTAVFLDEILKAHTVDVFHDDKVQVVVLVDVVGSNDVRMVEGRDRSRFAVEPFERRRILGLGRRQYLHGNLTAHELVFAEKHLAHAAGAEPLQHLVLADGEPLPFAEQKLFGLEESQ